MLYAIPKRLVVATSLRKSEALSIVADPTRNKIIRRLDEAKKAGYSDLLDSAEHVKHLTSTGNFNYHLNFLLENSIIVKDGIVYRLTGKGKEIARFLKDVDQIWNKLEPTIRDEKMSILGWAEKFQEETGIKMQKGASKLHEIELIPDEKKVIGLFAQEDCKREFFKYYKPLKVEDCKLSLKPDDEKTEKCLELVVSHPDLTYYISPQLLGAAFQFLSTHFEDAHVFVVKTKPFPFLLRAAEMGKAYDGCAFLIAPCVF